MFAEHIAAIIRLGKFHELNDIALCKRIKYSVLSGGAERRHSTHLGVLNQLHTAINTPWKFYDRRNQCIDAAGIHAAHLA